MLFNVAAQTTENLLLLTGPCKVLRRSTCLIKYSRLLEVILPSFPTTLFPLTKLSGDQYDHQSEWGEPTGAG